MKQQEIQEKVAEIQKKTELLKISDHKTLGDYLIVVPLSIEESGITRRVTQFEDRPEIGLVVSVGDAVDNIVVGDVIFFGRYSHVQLTYDDVSYYIMRAEDVYCVANN